MDSANIRQHVLLVAEAFDAWRVIPRLMILAYGYLVFNLYLWYKNIPTYVQEKCDATILSELLARGRSMAEIKQYACTVVDVVGGPTAAQSTFVTTIIGLSTGIFGLYTATGRKWDGWEPDFTRRSKSKDYYGPPDDDDRGRHHKHGRDHRLFGAGEAGTPSDTEDESDVPSDGPRP